jgi:hypothetical protein
MEKYSSIISPDCIKIFEDEEDLFIDTSDFDRILSILKTHIDSWYKNRSLSSHKKYNIIFTPNREAWQYSSDYYISAYTLYELVYIVSEKLVLIFGQCSNNYKRFLIKDGYLVDSIHNYNEEGEIVNIEYRQLLKVENKINVKDIIMSIITNPNPKISLESYYFRKLDLISYE